MTTTAVTTGIGLDVVAELAAQLRVMRDHREASRRQPPSPAGSSTRLVYLAAARPQPGKAD